MPRRSRGLHRRATPTTRPPRMSQGDGAGSRGRGFVEGVRRGWSTPGGGKLMHASEGCGRRGGELRKQLEAGDVLRADEAEMASVKGSDADCAESLSDGDEAAIDAAEVLIGVLNGERGDSSPVGCRQRFDADLAGGCGLVERGFGRRSELPVDQPSGLGDPSSVVTSGPGCASSSSRQAAWSGSLRSAAASSTPVSTTSVSDRTPRRACPPPQRRCERSSTRQARRTRASVGQGCARPALARRVRPQSRTGAPPPQLGGRRGHRGVARSRS